MSITEAEYARLLRNQRRAAPQRTTLPAPSEHEEQCAVIAWADAMQGKWPELAFLHHSPNGYARNKAVAAQIKRAGTRAGFPDLVLLCPRGQWHGLAIELKVQGGHTSPMQQAWIDRLRANGYMAVVVYGADEAIHAIQHYLEMP